MDSAKEKQEQLQNIGQGAFDAIAEMVEELEQAIENEEDDQQALEDAQQAIQEDPLSVEVRGDWYTPGHRQGENKSYVNEYRILLSTGGPATRIVGELDDYAQPVTAKLQVQDWFLSWTDFVPQEDDEVLLTYAQQFWYGE